MEKKSKKTAFTAEANGIMNAIITPIRFSLPIDLFPGSPPKLIEAPALWDTGAMGTVISKSLAHELELPSIGKTRCRGVNSYSERDTYIIDIYIGHIRIQNLRVIDGDLHSSDGAGKQEHRFLIGMDVIGHGDFAYTVRIRDGAPHSVFSFRFPSNNVPIDFVPETRKYNSSIAMAPALAAARHSYEQTHRHKPRKKRKK